MMTIRTALSDTFGLWDTEIETLSASINLDAEATEALLDDGTRDGGGRARAAVQSAVTQFNIIFRDLLRAKPEKVNAIKSKVDARRAAIVAALMAAGCAAA